MREEINGRQDLGGGEGRKKTKGVVATVVRKKIAWASENLQ